MKSHGLEMEGAISSSDGIESINIADITGKVTTDKEVEVDGDAQIDGSLKITTGSPLSGKIIYTSNAQGTFSYVYASVPSGETIIFDEDTAVTGYTLLTTVNDSLIYITKGSAAGGETGGTNKSGGTWTQPTHDHGGYTGYHTLTIAEMPSHRHAPVAGSFICSVGSGGTVRGGDNYTQIPYTGYTGGSSGHRHGLSTLTEDGTPSTWRPYGRNFTRQTKN
jgi:hypothetical protein